MAYGAHSTPYGAPRVSKLRRKRMNIVGVCVALFVPWMIFCVAFAIQSFAMHYYKPAACFWILSGGIIILGVMCVTSLLRYVKGSGEEVVPGGMSWSPFLWVTALIALLAAIHFGNQNFWAHTQNFYDLENLNTYNDVDPSRMRGQEVMDAGLISFVNGTTIDLRRSIGFKNVDIYCVAPISRGQVTADTPLASYDFWAVGRNCCSPDAGAMDFKCGQASMSNARSGLRVVRDEERAFYRLAVQQAQSAYQIKALHPLFFTWVVDPAADVAALGQASFRYYLAGMYGHFIVQLVLVGFAMCSTFSVATAA